MSSTDLQALTRPQLQALAKQRGVRANAKSEQIIDMLVQQEQENRHINKDRLPTPNMDSNLEAEVARLSEQEAACVAQRDYEGAARYAAELDAVKERQKELVDQQKELETAAEARRANVEQAAREAEAAEMRRAKAEQA
eukprot:2351060-Prymnesium_polylepis.1